MARKPRVEFPGALYHIIARGNRRTTLFHDEADYQAYLARLELGIYAKTSGKVLSPTDPLTVYQLLSQVS